MRKLILVWFIMLAFAACKKSNSPVNNNGGNGGSTKTKLAITDFSPKSAKPGATITITGTGFGDDASAVQVSFGNSPFDHPATVTPTTITIKTNDATLTGKIKLIVNGNDVSSDSDFTALLPDLRIIGFQGSAGQLGSSQLGHEVYIGGDGFGMDISNILVSFGGTKAVKPDNISPSGHTIGVTIPYYAKEGAVTISAQGQTVTSSALLTFDLSIADFTPKAFAFGDTVKISGFKFGNDVIVSFNNPVYTPAKILKVTPNELDVIVPVGATPGYIGVGTIGGDGANSFDKYTIIPTATFTNVVPESGKLNDIIRITGANFIGADPSKIGVSFGGSKPVKPTSIDGPNIYVNVPKDAKTGKITISGTGYRTYTGDIVFTVTL